MKKAITAAVLVAFMGAVAFASMENRNTSKQLQKQKKEQKEVKKKECRRTCLFSSL
jgi:cell division protein FtsN